MRDPAGLHVLEQAPDGVRRVFLVRADDSGRPALDPAGAIGALGSGDAAAVVRDRAAPLVERNVRDADAAVPDAAEDEAGLERLVLVRRHRDEPAVAFFHLVTDELHRFHLRFAVDRDGRMEEQEANDERLPARFTCGELAQDVHVASDMRVALVGAFDVRRFDADVGRGELTHLLQLLCRPRCLRRSAPADDHDLAYRRRADRVDRRIGRVGRRELLGSQRQHARDVERDVTVADHHRALDVQIERQLLVIGMAVVPRDELRRRPRAGQVFAGNAEPLVGLRAKGIDDCVVQGEEFAVRKISADLDVAEEAEARLLGNPLERARDALQLRVVGRDAQPHEPPRRRQPLEHVHLEPRLGVEQRAGGIETGRAGTNYGDTECTRGHSKRSY